MAATVLAQLFTYWDEAATSDLLTPLRGVSISKLPSFAPEDYAVRRLTLGFLLIKCLFPK